MAVAADSATSAAPRVKAALGRDAWLLRGLLALIGVYLLLSLVLPLHAVLSKSMIAYEFRFALIAIQGFDGAAWQPLGTLQDWTAHSREPVNHGLAPTARSRLPVSTFLAGDALSGYGRLRLRDGSAGGGLLLLDGVLSQPGQTLEADREALRRVLIRPLGGWSLRNYIDYFATPALRQSIANSLYIGALTTLITVTLAFAYAYALTRSCIPGKGVFKSIALVPILVPSLLPGLALVYLFGNQGLLKGVLLGGSIYGPLGMVAASVFFAFPHALLIILVALAMADARLYEAAHSLRASGARVFRTVTLPGAGYGLVSAALVTFSLTITDFGVPKVIGGQTNVLALDIYKQVVGQQNFEMGAVVAVLLLIPAVIAFALDRAMQNKQGGALSAGAVPYQPKPERQRDFWLFVYCIIVAVLILGLLAVCQFAALVKFWPYDLTPSLKNYRFDLMDGGGWDAYGNSIRMAAYVALAGTSIAFCGAYLVEKSRGLDAGKWLFQFLALMPMAIPGMVLGLAYIFFFNDPGNPLHFIYGTMTILVISAVTHFYTVPHLTATTALRQMDPEFEAVSASLQQPVYKLFALVTVPVCLPAILDIVIYLFVNAMTTVSAVVFLYSPATRLASVAVLNMDDAGDVAPAAAMGMMIFYTNALARLAQLAATRGLYRRTQAWRQR